MSNLISTIKQSTLAQQVGYLFGAIYLVVGLAGFAVTGGVGFLATQGKALIFFDVNPAHNIIHLAIGAALILAARAKDSVSRGVQTTIGAVYLLVGAAGLFIVGKSVNILALNQPDNALHLASAAVLLAAGLGLIKSRKVTTDHNEVPATITQVEAPSSTKVEARTTTAPSSSQRIRGGQKVTRAGVYRCSCQQFAVLVEAGSTLPECTVGKGHTYRFAGRPRSRATAS